MDRKWIDVSGKTEEEAVNKGLKELGLSRDDVSVEILERAKSGFLGIGGKPAKVRITYGLEEISEVSDMRSAPAQREEAPVKKASSGYGAGAVSSGQSDSGTDRSGKPAKPAKVEKPAKSEKAPKPEKAAKPAKPPVSVKVEKPVPQPESEAPEALGEPCDDENAQAIRKFLEGLLVHMGSSAQV